MRVHTTPINLSILDFKVSTRMSAAGAREAINLSILDFKAHTRTR